MNKFDLILWDSLKEIKKIKSNSVDLIVTSPPYFMGKDYDTSIKIEDFIEIHEKLFKDIFRVLKNWWSLCWQVWFHTKNDFLIPLDYLVYDIINRTINKTWDNLILRNRIIWTFWHWFHCSKKLSGRYETILWYTKWKDYHFDLDAIRIPQKYPWKTYYKGEKKGEISGNPLWKNPSDVWEIPNVKANHIEKTEHPCQFPVSLVSRLVRWMSPENWTILDPFMWSGSSWVAALINKRNFIWIELDEKYYQIAKDRCNKSIEWTIKFREDKPIYKPTGNLAVAKKPDYFI